jgi:integrase
MSLVQFSQVNPIPILDAIKEIKGYAEGTLQHKASAFISFTNYLSRQFDGFRRAIPQKQGVGRTFYSISEKCATATMTHKQWHDWLYELEQINYRDYLVAIVMLQGAKRISEVLSLQIGQIDWTMNRIEFKQSKTGGTLKYTVIVYPKSVMDKLKAYIGDREGLVFVTITGNKVCQNQLQVTFEKAGHKAGIKYKIHPHVLRASAITYLVEQGYSSDQIMRISGHSSQKSVLYYDRSDIVNNISSEVCLV